MKLTSLNPRWVSYGGHGISKAGGSAIPERIGVGITFVCPCGECNRRIFLNFSNPIDGGSAVNEEAQPIWKRTGDTFENLTLTPSILRTKPRGCGWHGYLTKGELTSV